MPPVNSLQEYLYRQFMPRSIVPEAGAPGLEDVLRPPGAYHPPEVGPQFGGEDYGRPFEPTPGPPQRADMPRAQRVDEATGQPGNRYEQLVSQYLESLQQPLRMPAPPPLSPLQGMAVALNPERREQMMAQFREPYTRQIQEMSINEQRRGQAAEFAAGMLERQEVRKRREEDIGFRQQTQDRLIRQQSWQHEMALANAGIVDYPYKNPELKLRAEAIGREKKGRIARAQGSAVQKHRQMINSYRDDLDKLTQGILQISNDINILDPATPEYADYERRLQAMKDRADRLEKHVATLEALSPDEAQMILGRPDADALLDEAYERFQAQRGGVPAPTGGGPPQQAPP